MALVLDYSIGPLLAQKVKLASASTVNLGLSFKSITFLLQLLFIFQTFLDIHIHFFSLTTCLYVIDAFFTFHAS